MSVRRPAGTFAGAELITIEAGPMRRTLSAALACTALALAAARPAGAQARASACRRTDAARTFAFPASSERLEDIRHGVVFRCTLRAGGAVRRVVVAGDSLGGAPEALLVEGPRGTQRFALGRANTPPPAGSRVLGGEDLNGDGWTDLLVLLSSGAQGQLWYAVFRYDPARARFVEDDSLSGGGNIERLTGRGCVRTTANYLSRLDRDDFCWRGGGWVKVRSEEGRNTGPGVWVTVRHARVAGRMRVVAVDTTRENGR